MFERLHLAVLRRVGALRARYAVRLASKVLHGPGRVRLKAGEVAVISLMKDAGYFVGDFIRHHQALGAAHIVIVDNGSSDDTVAIAKGFGRVTVVENRLPAKLYECLLRVGVARQVVRGGWFLFVDSDEMFEPPPGGDLPGLAAYLEARGYTAMVVQMLDMYCAAPYGETKFWDYAQTRARFARYSLGGIVQLPYHDRERIGFEWFLRDNDCPASVVLNQGGVRQEVFGERPFLSKHSLVRNKRGSDPMPHPHCAQGVRVADVTGVLRHYKLAGTWLDRDARSVALGTWDHAEDSRRLAAAQAGDGFKIAVEGREWRGTAALVAEGFLVTSDAWRDWVSRRNRARPSTPHGNRDGSGGCRDRS